MGKDKDRSVISDLKTGKSVKQAKLSRQTVLGSNTLALFITPSCSSINNDEYIISSSLQKQIPNSTAMYSPSVLFDMLKEVNRYIVKGIKLYESFKELNLSGWVSPHTLLLTGPAEDMKVIRHAWVKRYLRNPLGYLIKDVGIIQEFFVELLPQSPFLSLKTALFDAVADLNDQSVYPSKENLREYLKKHYPDVKLPDIKHVHECLGRLVRERRLYHNGCGYFVLCNVNVLNELKVNNNNVSPNNVSSSESTKGERFISSPNSQFITETDLSYSDVNTTNSTYSSNERSFPSYLESNHSRNNKTIKNFFKKHIGTMKKENPNSKDFRRQPINNNVHSSDINTLNECLYVKDSNISCNSSQKETEVSPGLTFVKENDSSPRLKSVDKLNTYSSSTDREDKIKHSNKHSKKRGRNSTLIRSLSFDGSDIDNNNVTFPVVGQPSVVLDKNSETDNFRRSFSFGAGSSKYHDKAHRKDIKKTDTGEDITVHLECSRRCNEQSNVSPIFCDKDDQTIYDFLLKSENSNLLEVDRPELLYNYENLGSTLSFNENNHTEYTVMDLASPPICTSLAEELKKVEI